VAVPNRDILGVAAGQDAQQEKTFLWKIIVMKFEHQNSDPVIRIMSPEIGTVMRHAETEFNSLGRSIGSPLTPRELRGQPALQSLR
jgi:hypothetical protein